MRWKLAETIDADADKELESYPAIVRQLLFNRGVRSSADAEKYFNPSWDQIPDVDQFYSMDKAVSVLESAIDAKEKIFIHGDFDADGICATVLLWEYLYRVRGADVLPYIPSRVDEGYGLSEKSLDSIIDQGGKCIVTVDCGIRDIELVRKYRRTSKKTDGLKFVITDHHEPGEKVPAYVPVIHPLHPKGDYPYKYLSGASVAWMLVAAMEKARNASEFSWEQVPGIDLAAFATICDMMPLSDVNRVIVEFGLRAMREMKRPGISALSEEAGISQKDIEAYHIGYVLGPRINASGRIGDPMDAVRLFSTKNESRANAIARDLGRLNKERQDITDTLYEEVRSQIEAEGTGRHLYVAHGNDWPEGIIGLVASKVQQRYHHPVILMTDGEEFVKGSARSIPGFSIVNAIESLGDLLANYGGHDQAAGFSIKSENVDEFKKLLEEIGEKEISKEMLTREVSADAVAEVGDIDWGLYETINKMEPFGYGNRRPVFWVKSAVVDEARSVGDGSHVKFTLRGNKDKEKLEAIFFRASEEAKTLVPGADVEVVGNVDKNSWNGNEIIQMKIIDISAPAQ